MKRRDFFKLFAGLPFLGFLRHKAEISRKVCKWDDSMYCMKDTDEGCNYLDYLAMCPDEEWTDSTSNANTFVANWRKCYDNQSTSNTYPFDPWGPDEADLYTLNDGKSV